MFIQETLATLTLTDHDLLPSLLRYYLDGGHAITLWQLPNSTEKHLLICSDGVRPVDDVVLEKSETGFIFAPFDPTKAKLFFKASVIYTFKDGRLQTGPEEPPLPTGLRKHSSDETSSPVPYHAGQFQTKSGLANYKKLVANCIERIGIGDFEKIVPSRPKEVILPDAFDVWKAFQKLAQAYPTCMISLVSSEETGTWLGATPELLASVDDKMWFRTVALAGTQKSKPGQNIKSVAWTEKEIEEQALVSRYIISCFKKIRLREYEEHGPRTVSAGRLLHLRTDYKVDMTATNFPQLGTVMLQLLHPTSAVCGMPLAQSREFLLTHEGYDREFYTGFLGPLGVNGESHVYVNLRCMQLTDKKAILYAGAGVTIDSDPDQEWEETEMKLDTLWSTIA